MAEERPNGKRWQQVDDLFARALDLPQSECLEFLRSECADDPGLFEEVASLLRITERMEGFLETPPGRATGGLWLAIEELGGSSDGLQAGDRIDAYRVVRKLSRGGMGTVFLAERSDDQFHKRVALKVLRRGLDTEDIVGRFLAERQILASLSHPNIAQLLDGGVTEDGRPYLVMELVDGLPIDRYCDSHRLTIRQRLELFTVVTSAVQHAHRKLVIHRDLKPANILVDRRGTVKLVDFGIAKLLDASAVPSRTPATRAGQQLMTPEYASPEQMRGESMTAASDIYQLGLLLHELLVGCRPSPPRKDEAADDSVPPPSSVSVSAEVAAARSVDASTLRRALRGDLDTIVMCALRGDPERRYATVNALGQDIRRYLEGKPVSAQRDTWPYRARKFVGRNRWLVAGSLVISMLLLGYLVTLYRFSRQMEVERNTARDAAARARQVKNLMVGMFESADPFADPEAPSSGRDVTVREALTLGAERIGEDLAEEPALRSELLVTISDVMDELDLVDEATPLREEALELQERILGADSPEVARSLLVLASLAARAGEWGRAEQLLDRYTPLATEIHGPDSPELAIGLTDLGGVYGNTDRFDESVRVRDQAVAIYRRAGPEHAEDLASALSNLSMAHLDRDDLDEALATAREALAIQRGLNGDGHPRTALARVQLAQVQREARNFDEAARLYDLALPVLERELGEEHWLTINTLNNYALVLTDVREFREAEKLQRRVLAIRRDKYGEPNAEVASSLQNLGVNLTRQERYEEAEQLHRQAYDAYRRALGESHHLVAFPLLSLSWLQLRRGAYPEAEQSAAEARRILRSVLPDGHFAVAMAECRLGRAIAGAGRAREAEPLLSGSLDKLASTTQVPLAYERECLQATHDVYLALGWSEKAADISSRIASLADTGS